MRPDGFTLAATTNDLTREPEVRDVADVVEFRMDKAENPLEQLAEYDGDLSLLATNRGRAYGGQAAEAGRVEDLSTAAEFDCVAMVDVELEVVRERDEVVPALRDEGVDVVVSHHDFDGTPDAETLDAVFEECAGYGDVAKVATLAETAGDALGMLNAVHRATNEGKRVAGIAMGGVGSHTRVVAPLYGSRLGYAPLASDTSEYAPGQLSIRTLATMIETLGSPDRHGADLPDEEDAATSNGVVD
jgi:3-dehydroquinate dehydratase-1